MKRLYTFGCSFTRYDWPTWADILGCEFDHYENWGLGGGGNHFIFNSLVECLIKNKMTHNDYIVVMWSSMLREDRYVNNQWLPLGNIFNSPVYDSDFIKKYADPKGYFLRDLAFIHAAAKILDYYKVPYIFTSMIPLNKLDELSVDLINDSDDIINAYQKTINLVRPSVYETIFNFDWASRPLFSSTTVAGKKYLEVAGAEWPDFKDYLNKKTDGIDQKIIDEIKKFKIDDWIHWGKRSDSHPIPLEHLEYIDKILPEFNISDQTREWVKLIREGY